MIKEAYRTRPNSRCNDPKEYEELNSYQRRVLQKWIDECVAPHRVQNFNPYHTSYGLKHLFEESDRGFYITNGQFKGAMLSAGLEPKSHHDINWTYKIGRRAGTLK